MLGHRRAFTLIELLIVVAIIAILAAIAVPNFLEAQTRSKVSRARADMRTVATALESYYVDNNSYPYTESIDDVIWMIPGGTPLRSSTGDRPGGLTSPIAYITSVPIDPFKHLAVDSSGVQLATSAPLYYEIAGFAYINGTRTNINPVNVPADAVGTSSMIGIGADTEVRSPWETPSRWLLYSLGPDLTNHLVDLNSGAIVSRSRYNLNNRYDPTNGTVSAGNVLRVAGRDI